MSDGEWRGYVFCGRLIRPRLMLSERAATSNSCTRDHSQCENFDNPPTVVDTMEPVVFSRASHWRADDWSDPAAVTVSSPRFDRPPPPPPSPCIDTVVQALEAVDGTIAEGRHDRSSGVSGRLRVARRESR